MTRAMRGGDEHGPARRCSNGKATATDGAAMQFKDSGTPSRTACGGATRGTDDDQDDGRRTTATRRHAHREATKQRIRKVCFPSAALVFLRPDAEDATPNDFAAPHSLVCRRNTNVRRLQLELAVSLVSAKRYLVTRPEDASPRDRPLYCDLLLPTARHDAQQPAPEAT